MCVVSNRVVRELGLQSAGFIDVSHAGGEATDIPVYYVDLLLFNGVQLRNVRVGLMSAKGIDVIVGIDIINRGDFAVSNRDGATTFSFRIPSIERFDFVQADNRQASASDLGTN